MVAQAKKRIAVVDRSKFGVVAGWQICPVEVCDLIITDSEASNETIHPYVELGVQVHRV